MGLFKKDKKPIIIDTTCPVEGCAFSANDEKSLQRHKEWKHPELAGNTKMAEWAV
jgi:hypothetical protein